MGSPITLKRRPRTPSPTGTLIGPPVSVTLMPRFKPSVEDIAIERTQFSPRCCCTSSVSVEDHLEILILDIIRQHDIEDGFGIWFENVADHRIGISIRALG